MISLLNKNDQLNENKNSLNVSYVRKVNIIFGHYPYPNVIHNFIISIKSKAELEKNIDGSLSIKKLILE